MSITKNIIEKAAFGGAQAMIEAWAVLARKHMQRLSGSKEEQDAAQSSGGSSEGVSANNVSGGSASDKAAPGLTPLHMGLSAWAAVLLLVLLYMHMQVRRLQHRYDWLNSGAAASLSLD
jgi:hypothetical protein